MQAYYEKSGGRSIATLESLEEQLDPCMMSDDVAYAGSDKRVVLPIQVESIKSLWKLYDDTEISSNSFFKSVWSLVLCNYLCMAKVCFAVVEPLAGDPIVPYRDLNLSIFSHTINQDATVKELFQQKEAQDFFPSKHQSAKGWASQVRGFCNTIIIFDEPSEEKLENWLTTAHWKIALFVTSTSIELATTMQIELAHGIAETVRATISRVRSGLALPLRSMFELTTNDLKSLEIWNGKAPESSLFLIHELVKAKAESQPRADAVNAWDGNLSYSELDDLAVSISLNLLRLGVGPEIPVILCIEKSKWAVVTILAVLKAGGVCVPVLPSFPQERIDEIIKQTDAKIAISGFGHQKKFKHLGSQVISLSPIYITSYPVSIIASPRSHVDVENTALILFTSGSSGVPKGVLKDHASLLTSNVAHGRTFSMNAESRVLQFTALTWSIGFYDIISTLISGGCVCVPSEHDRINRLAAAIQELGVTHVTTTPSVIASLEPERVPSLKTIILSGEPVTRTIVEQWSKKVQLFNLYGMSEASFVALTRVAQNNNSSIVGARTSSCCSWIVDPRDYNRLLPIGAIGEILVEGRSVASGYLKDSQQTLASFVGPPTWAKKHFPGRFSDSSRFFRTGDLARYTPRGEIEMMGRSNDQIKIRGQRVELGEVEHHLRRLIPLAKDVATGLSIYGTRKRPSLTAYICLIERGDARAQSDHGDRERIEDSLSSVRESLETSLPTYMIPSTFFVVPDFPKTSTGKLDRRKLRKLGEENCFGAPLQLDKSPVVETPRSFSNKERFLLPLWSNVLGLDISSFTPFDNFFLLGGDSVDAIRLVDILETEGLSLTVPEVFRYPKLTEMASAVRKAGPREEQPTETPFSLLPTSWKSKIISEATEQCGIIEEAIEDIFPCTPLQEGLMALSRLQTGSYIAQYELCLVRSWTRDQVERAWKALVAETAILRTRIIQSELHRCYQVVLRHNVEGLVTWKPAEATHAGLPAMNFGEALIETEFVETGSPRQIKWYWTVHHSVYDGWSVDLILRRFQQLLSYTHMGNKLMIKSSFRTYVEYLLQKDLSLAENYWKSQLADFSGSQFPVVPHIYKAQANQEYRRQVSILSKGLNFTMSTLIRAAWSIILARYTNDPDVMFGATVTGRTARIPGIKDIIGPTIATVPVRTLVNKGETIAQYLASIQQQSTEMLEYEHLGLQNIQRLNSGAASACRFQNLLIVQPHREVAIEQDFVQKAFHSENYMSYPLTVECKLDREKMSVEAIFDKQIIEPSQLHRILDQFIHVLQQLQLHADSEWKIGDLQVISPEDEEKIFGWNAVPPISTYSCIIPHMKSMIECPRDVAVCSWDGEFPYKELHELSNILSHRLLKLGVGPEEFVPICFRKTKWVVVAILAVIKAGGAFVLLDVSHPLDRLEQIVKSLDAKSAVCLPEDTERVVKLGLRMVNCQVQVSKSSDLEIDSPKRLADPHDALYATFTSGSTGKPKGIIIEHWQCTSGFLAQIKSGLFSKNTRILQFATASFDSAIEQILCPLLAGGTVCIPHEDDKLQNLGKVICDLRVNVADLTPSVAKLLMPKDVPNLEVLRLSGEPISEMLPRRWANHVRVENSYGPSECCVTSMTNTHLVVESNPLNIGHSVGCLAWIVDPGDPNKLAPIGTIGELVIDGPIVARGYINEQNKSNSPFLRETDWARDLYLKKQPERSEDRPDRRFYRTGDLVYYESDGSICFVGRNDSQVKIRGQRIEPDEIEHHIRSHNGIAEAIVIKPAKGPWQGKLVAILQLNSVDFSYTLGDDQVEVIEIENSDILFEFGSLRQLLADRVPSFMIPTEWIAIRHFPLSRSGKIDRKRLERWLETISPENAEALRKNPESGSRSSMPTLLSADEVFAQSISNVVIRLGAKGDSKLEAAMRGQDISLQAAGIDSISVIFLLKAIKQEFRVELPLCYLQGGMTVRSVAKAVRDMQLGNSNTSRTSFDFVDEINQLMKRFHLGGMDRDDRSLGTSKLVLLTGATGYLGTQLLRYLLDSEPLIEVAVLVRQSEEHLALERLIRSAKLAQWWSIAYLPRIEIWLGDLEKPYLGLSSSNWERLVGSSHDGENIHAVIHNGAVVDWFQGYKQLKAANTVSTAYLMQALKDSSSLERLVYVSGGPQWDPNSTHSDGNDAFNARLQALNGYGQSKLVGERLIEKANSSKAFTIKPGLVIGNLANGIANIDDFIWRVVAGSLLIGCFNADEKKQWIFLASSDTFSQKILDCMKLTEVPREIKILDGLTVEQFWKVVTDTTGRELRPTSHSEWLQQLQQSIEASGPDHPCWPIIQMVQRPFVLGCTRPAQVDSEDIRTQQAADVVARNIQYLLGINYLPTGGLRCVVKESFRRRAH